MSLWLVYFLAASGSLMIIAHADVILATAGAGPALSHIAPSVFALGNIAGSFFGGPWAGTRSPRAALAPAILLSLAGMTGLAANLNPAAQLACLTMLGMAYGAVITAIPAVIRRRLGDDDFGPAFGRVFTAWGAAGLCGPSIGSLLSEAAANYLPALMAAAAATAVAFILTLQMNRNASP